MKHTIEYEEGDLPVLTCRAGGNPKPVVMWYQGNTLLTDNTEQTLKVKSPGVEAKHSYTCYVSNKYGNISHTFELKTKGTFLSFQLRPDRMCKYLARCTETLLHT